MLPYKHVMLVRVQLCTLNVADSSTDRARNTTRLLSSDCVGNWMPNCLLNNYFMQVRVLSVRHIIYSRVEQRYRPYIADSAISSLTYMVSLFCFLHFRVSLMVSCKAHNLVPKGLWVQIPPLSLLEDSKKSYFLLKSFHSRLF